MISACVIVKNEEKHLPLWLESMGRIADEFVVVDTGSTDDTVKLAEEAGAQIFHFDWIDDFAAAKNFALAQAKGDWIVSCDADETFTPEDAAHVRQAIEEAEPGVAGFACLQHDLEADGRVRDHTVNVRVFRNYPNLRYQGAIHEQIAWIDGRPQGEFPYREDFIIQHTGHFTENITGKFQRNIKILERIQAEGKARPVDIYQLAESYYGLQDYAKALSYIEKFLTMDVRILGSPERPQSLRIQSLICLQHPAEEVYRELAAAEKEFPEAPVFPWIRGVYAYERGEREEAERALLHCAAIAESLPDNPIETRMSHVYSRLGNLRYEKGDFAAAAAWWQKGLAETPYNGEALGGLLRLLSEAEAEDAELIGFLSSRYDAKRDAAFIVAALPEGREKVELYYRLQGKLPTPPWTLYRLAGNYGAASAALFEEQTALARVLAAAGSDEEREALPIVYRAALTAPKTPADYRARRGLRTFMKEYKSLQQEGKP